MEVRDVLGAQHRFVGSVARWDFPLAATGLVIPAGFALAFLAATPFTNTALIEENIDRVAHGAGFAHVVNFAVGAAIYG